MEQILYFNSVNEIFLVLNIKLTKFKIKVLLKQNLLKKERDGN